MRSIHANSKWPSSRFPDTPRGFAYADHVNAGLLHQLDVFIQAVLRHVLFIERGAIEERIHLAGSKTCGSLRTEKQAGTNGNQPSQADTQRCGFHRKHIVSTRDLFVKTEGIISLLQQPVPPQGSMRLPGIESHRMLRDHQWGVGLL